jgi:hypothetical protein
VDRSLLSMSWVRQNGCRVTQQVNRLAGWLIDAGDPFSPEFNNNLRRCLIS